MGLPSYLHKYDQVYPTLVRRCWILMSKGTNVWTQHRFHMNDLSAHSFYLRLNAATKTHPLRSLSKFLHSASSEHPSSRGRSLLWNPLDESSLLLSPSKC